MCTQENVSVMNISVKKTETAERKEEKLLAERDKMVTQQISLNLDLNWLAISTYIDMVGGICGNHDTAL